MAQRIKRLLQCGRPGFDPWVGKIPREGNGNPLQYSCLENPMDRGAWWVTVHGVTKSWTRLSNFTHTKLVQWFVWASHRWDLCWVFVCLFVFPLMGKAEWGDNPVCWWLGLYFCLLFRWGILHRVLLEVGWCQVLYSSGFLFVSSHYLILPIVSSLVV